MNLFNFVLLAFADFVPAIITGVIALALGATVGIMVYKNAVVAKTLKAKESAAKIVEDAMAEAKALKKEAILDAKEEANKIKEETENECKIRRQEVLKSEERLNAREDFINNKIPEEDDVTFDLIDNLDQLIVPNYYSYLLEDVNIHEIKNFNKF